MKRFPFTLQVELQPDRKYWKLLSEFTYLDPNFGDITVDRDFISDFASVPRLPLLFTILGQYGHAAAVIHDWLYFTKQLDRSSSDRVFLNALRSSGIARWRAWLLYGGVRLFGNSRWKANGNS